MDPFTVICYGKIVRLQINAMCMMQQNFHRAQIGDTAVYSAQDIFSCADEIEKIIEQLEEHMRTTWPQQFFPTGERK